MGTSMWSERTGAHNAVLWFDLRLAQKERIAIVGDHQLCNHPVSFNASRLFGKGCQKKSGRYRSRTKKNLNKEALRGPLQENHGTKAWRDPVRKERISVMLNQLLINNVMEFPTQPKKTKIDMHCYFGESSCEFVKKELIEELFPEGKTYQRSFQTDTGTRQRRSVLDTRTLEKSPPQNFVPRLTIIAIADAHLPLPIQTQSSPSRSSVTSGRSLNYTRHLPSPSRTDQLELESAGTTQDHLERGNAH